LSSDLLKSANCRNFKNWALTTGFFNVAAISLILPSSTKLSTNIKSCANQLKTSIAYWSLLFWASNKNNLFLLVFFSTSSNPFICVSKLCLFREKYVCHLFFVNTSNDSFVISVLLNVNE